MKDDRIGKVIGVLRRREGQWKETAVEEISRRKRDPFRVLIGCLLSLRTKDETTGPATKRLFRIAATPEDMRRLTARRIEKAIYPVGFYRVKARRIRGLCDVLVREHGGKVPDTMEGLLSLKGVGRKTANLVLTQGHDRYGICVDIHVHRITNRWGYVRTKSPDATETALREKLPRRYWKSINGLLVRFGQNVCRPLSPHCSSCPLTKDCDRTGVSRSR